MTDESEDHQKFSILEWKAHDGFNMNDLEDDISIITIDGEFEFNDKVQPIPLFEAEGNGPPAGINCTNAGWGLLDSSDFSSPCQRWALR